MVLTVNRLDFGRYFFRIGRYDSRVGLLWLWRQADRFRLAGTGWGTGRTQVHRECFYQRGADLVPYIDLVEVVYLLANLEPLLAAIRHDERQRAVGEINRQHRGRRS